MLEGLEISEISNNSLERTLRLDAEFYSKFNLGQQKLFNDIGAQSLSNFATISDGNHMSISDNFVDEGVPYYRGGDIYNVFIESTPSPLRIPKHIFDMPTMQRSHLQKGDVLMSIVGAIIGNISLVTTNDMATCSCKLAIIRPHDNMLLPEYVGMYLMSKYGQQQIQKFRRGSGQTGLILEDFDQLLIPNIDSLVQKEISEIVNQSYDSLKTSRLMYESAENYFLECLGMKDFNPQNEVATIKRFSDFTVSGRLDAEYYRKRYDDLFEKLSKYKCKELGNIVSVKKSIEPGSEKYQKDGIPFIRVSDISKFEIQETELHLSEKEFNLDKLRPHKDTILFSKDGSIGIAYKCETDLDVITSGALLHLDVIDSDVSSDYLTLVLNSLIVRLQAERDYSGAIIQHWKTDDIKKVIIPILPTEAQKQIVQKVKQSMALRTESKELLKTAKKKVEDVICEISKRKQL